MPTGYTADIKDGISFRQFAMNCARAFGATITMRDEPADTPIPEAFVPSSYHADQLRTLKIRRAQIEAMTDDGCQLSADSEYAAEAKRIDEGIAERAILKKKYEAMLSEAVRWTPPTEDHVKFKDFMCDQIKKSIEFDCGTKYLEDNRPKQIPGSDWKVIALRNIDRSIDYCTRCDAEEIQRTNERNNWIRQLRDSLKPQA